MKKLVCELCGSNALTKDGDFFVCDFCRTKYTLDQAKKLMVEGTVEVDRRRELPNLLTLAKAALDGGNPGEAYDYANRALEIDAESSEAWLLKGKAAGWSSTILNFRVSEMIGSFVKAESFAEIEDRDSLRKDCAKVLHDVAIAVHNLSWDHTQKFVQLGNTWAEHISRCEQIIAALQTSYEWSPERKALDNIIAVASNLVVGIRFTSFSGESSVVSLQPAFKQKMQELIDSTSVEIKKLDDTFVAPQPVTHAPSSCFVVTATMGSELAFPVVTLRTFRDQVIVQSKIGRRFVSWYSVNGPLLAKTIAPSRVLRGLSLIIIVLPSTAIAWAYMHMREFIFGAAPGSPSQSRR